MRRLAIALVGVIGLSSVLSSSAVEEEWAKPVEAPAAPKPPAPSPPPVMSAQPAAKLNNQDGCQRKSQCASGHCCFTIVGSICAASCSFADTGMPGAEDRCESSIDCGKAQKCVVRATVGSSVFKVCE